MALAPLEINDSLYNFTGGLNTKAAKPSQEASDLSTILNWEFQTAGGLKVRGGKTKLNSVTSPKHRNTTLFSGAGLDDGTSGGTYTGTTNSRFTVQIDGTGTPDTFQWRKDSGSWTTAVAITGAAQTLSGAVTITFAATTGHTLNDIWYIDVGIFDGFPVYALFPFYITGGTSQVLAIAGNTLWKYDAANNYFSPINITGGGFTGSQRAFSICQFTDTSDTAWVVICNGRDSPVYYNGTTATRLSSTGSPHADWTGTTQPAQIVPHRNRLYAFVSGKATVYASNLGSITNMRDWTTVAATATISLLAEYGAITALWPFYTTLLVFLKDSIRRIDGTGPDDYSTLPSLVSAVLGCENFKTIQAIGSDVLFTSRVGVHSLSGVTEAGDIRSSFISEKLEASTAGTLALATWDDINKGSGRLDTDACSVYYTSKNQYWLSCGRDTATTNNIVFVADARVAQPRAAWTLFDYTIASAACVDTSRISLASAVSGQVEKDLVVFGDYSGVVWVHDIANSDDGGNITASFTKYSKGKDGGTIHKSYRKLMVWMRDTGASLTLNDTYDLGSAGSGFGTTQVIPSSSTGSTNTFGATWTLGTDAFGTSAGYTVHRVDLKGQGRMMEAKFSYADTKGMTILGYDLYARPIRLVTQN